VVEKLPLLFAKQVGSHLVLELIYPPPVFVTKDAEDKCNKRIGSGHYGTGKIYYHRSASVVNEYVVQLVQVSMSDATAMQIRN